MNGFFQLQRRFFSHWLWKDDDRIFSRAEAFLDLLQLAAFTRTKKVVGAVIIPLEPGQIVASERFVAGRWKWSTSKVRAFLTLLEADGMVKKQIKQGVTIITLCNYKRYADGMPPEKAGINHAQSTFEAPSKQREEREDIEPTQPKGARANRIPSIEDCEAVACERLPAAKEWAASVARQFHAIFTVHDWLNQRGEDLLHRGKWKARLLQMLEEESRKSGGGRRASPPAEKQRPGSNLGDSTSLEGL